MTCASSSAVRTSRPNPQGMRRLAPCLLLLLGACASVHDRATIDQVRWSLRADSLGSAAIGLYMESALPPDSGFAVPNAQQAEDGALHVRFRLADPSGQGARFRYIIYYRNESYAFGDGEPAALLADNFYGTWADGFHLSPTATPEGIHINERITIRSDPRGEFPGKPWARNPRTGRYSLLIVALPEAEFDQKPPPPELIDPRIRTGQGYTEPYAYWLHGSGAARREAVTLLVPDVCELRVQLDPLSGVLGCFGARPEFEPFIHTLDTNQRFGNIPLIADVLDNSFTRTTYDSLLSFTAHTELISATPYLADVPCANIGIDSATRALIIRNPAASPQRPRKVQTGVITRHAFTYGRYRVHAQLSPLLNDSDLWNGLTNAIWLIGTGVGGPLRRPCEGGYLTTGSDPGQTGRIPRSNYAEIDFEIMKGMPLCPERAFPPIYPQPIADPNDRSAWLRKLPPEVIARHGQVSVACTNWDLACPDAPDFGIGCQDIVFDGEVFYAHRWDRDYRALTEKHMAPDDELFGPAGYWFEIDWRPTEIIWRIGPSPDHLRVIGYMDRSMTSIPDVPMRLTITQEFHNTAWWPGCPYEQGGIPFPAKDLVGRIHSVTVE